MSVCKMNFLFACRAKDAGQYERNGARFQRSQSQNDLDRQAYDDRFYSPTDVRFSASGFDIQQRDTDQALRRHPSDVGDRYRRSYDEWNGTRVPLTALDNTDVSRTSALDDRQMDQKYRPPTGTSKNLESPRHGEPRDTGYGRDYDGRRIHSEGDEFRPGRENSANVNKRPSVRNDIPKNQDIINWLQHGDDRDSQPRDLGYAPDRADLDHSASSYSHSVGNRTGDEPSNQAGYRAEPSRAELLTSQTYPAARADGELVAGGEAGVRGSLMSGPKADNDNVVYPQFRVSNPMYDAGHRASLGEQTHSSDGSIKGKDVVGQQQGHNWSIARWPNTEHSHEGSHGPVRGVGYEPASSGNQRDGPSQISPLKPVHAVMSNSPAYRSEQLEDLPPSLPPKLANQQAPLKPPHVIPGQLDQYQRTGEVPFVSLAGDHPLRVRKDDSSNQMDLTSEYAVVRKRTAQPVVDDFSWRPEVERSRADGAGYQLDMGSRSRQSPDGTLDSPNAPSGKSNLTIQPLAVGVTSSGDIGKERRPAMKSSSHEDLTSSPSVRSPLPLDNTVAVSGVPENFSGPRRSEPQGGAENIDPQVNVLFDS